MRLPACEKTDTILAQEHNFLCHNFPAMHAPPPHDAALRTLLRSFRAQRPLRAGSLLVTMFGDAIAPRGGAVTLGSLIALAAPFGLTERLVRTSVARLAREGWLAARRQGRRSEYQLTAAGAARFAEATRRIYAAAPLEWDGHWTLLLLERAARAPRVQRELRWLGFGQLSPTLLAHPACSARQAREWLQRLAPALHSLALSCTTGDLGADRAVAAQGWDLAQLARRYRRFLARLQPVGAALQARPPSAQDAFVLRTLLIHEFRKIHLQDPLLPPQLLPPDWVGTRAYELCARLYAKVFTPAEAHLSAVAECLEQPLPALSPTATAARFGGVVLARVPAA
jgi:phenylacetic acid degradation operon negative regulatory protein